MNQPRIPLLSRLALLAGASALTASVPASATSPQANDLTNRQWHQVTAQVAPPNGACNYLYIDGTGRMVYYGQSGACATRLNQHYAAMRSGYEMLAQAYHFLPENTAVELLTHLQQWVTEVDQQRRPLNHGQSDNCLGVLSAGGQPIIWFKALADANAAAHAEACVLAEAVGFCNRLGAGNTRPSSGQFTGILQRCGA
jgi:hypothetical protein